MQHSLLTPDTWYERAKMIAKKKGISIKNLASQINVSPSTVGHYLTGRCDPPIERLVRISRILEVSLNFLLEGNEEDTENVRLKHEIETLKGQLEIERLKYQLELEKLKNLIDLKKEDTLALLSEALEKKPSSESSATKVSI